MSDHQAEARGIRAFHELQEVQASTATSDVQPGGEVG